MVRPRSQQILNLKTRYSSFGFIPTPGAAENVFAEGDVFAFTITDLVGGAETDAFAGVRTPTPGPFAIAAGDTFSVSTDGAPAVNVVLASTDTTASRIAAKAVAAGAFAAASEGFLSVFSPTPGSDGSIVLADVVPGTLAKLGLVAGTTTGIDAPVRGVVTRSLDGRGGIVPLKTLDGRDLVTDAPSSVLLTEGFLTTRFIEKPGGVPIHARLTWAGGDFTFKYFTFVPTRPEVETFNSDFGALDGTDTIDFTVEDPEGGLGSTVLTVTFPGGPALTRDQVVSRINEQWADLLTLSGTGQAHITCTLTGPYTWGGIGDEMEVSVDGGPFQSVTFLAADVSPADVMSRFNGAIAGATASVDISGKVRIDSDNIDGTTSSLEFRGIDGFSVVFQTLGLSPGKYRGYFIAQPSGPSEIKIFGVGRGSQATLDISSLNATTLTRMGLTAGTRTGTDEGEEPVDFPLQTQLSTPALDPVLAMIPEVMDFGEVLTNEESTVVKFGSKAAGSALVSAAKNNYFDVIKVLGLGIKDSGKAAILGADGTLPQTVLGSARNEYEAFFRQFIRGDFQFRTVDALVTNQLETGGTAGNPMLKSSFFNVDIDPDDTQGGLRVFRVRFGRDVTPLVPFIVSENPATGLDWAVEARDASVTAFGNAFGSVKFYDFNTKVAGDLSGGDRFIPFSGGTAGEGDAYLRLLDSDVSADAIEKSIIHRLNATMELTIGDGTLSFGDFNGADAINDAMAFAAAKSVSNLVLKIKRGFHSVTAAIVVPAFNTVRIEGISIGGSIISTSISSFMVVGSSTVLVMSDIALVKSTAPFGIISAGAGAGIWMERVNAANVTLQMTNVDQCHLSECLWSATDPAANVALFQVFAGDGTDTGPYVFEDCFIAGPNNHPVLFISSAGDPLTAVGPIRFVRCKIRLGSTTVDGDFNLVGNCGVLDLDPNGRNSLTDTTGAYVTEVGWIDCDVRANALGSGAENVLIHVHPGANGVATSGTPHAFSDPAMRVNRLSIRGGRWFSPSQFSNVNPFTIGLAWSATGGAGDVNDYNSGIVDIEDVIMGFDQTGTVGFVHGGPTGDIGTWFTSIVSPSGPPSPFAWGAFAIAANYLNVKNIRIVGLGQNSRSGDLFLKCDRVADVDGVKLTDYKPLGPDTHPLHRVTLRFGSFTATSPTGFGRATQHRIRNFDMRGVDTSAGSWATFGFFAIEPVAIPTYIDHLTIANFRSSAVPSNDGIRLIDAAFGALYTDSTSNFDDLHFSNLNIQSCVAGLRAFISDSTLLKWSIRDSLFTRNTDGLVITCASRLGNFDFSHNTVVDNTSSGVFISVANWIPITVPTRPSHLVAKGNTVQNNPSPTGTQWEVVSSGVVDNVPRGIFIGNYLGQSNAIPPVEGDFKINRISGGISAPLASPSNPGATGLMRGLETGHDTALATSLTFVSGGNMHRNTARLITP